MKHFLLPILGLFFCHHLYAQEFLAGELTFTNQKVMEGKIAVDFITNTVILASDETYRIFHASVLSQVTTVTPEGKLVIYKTYRHKTPGLLTPWESQLFQVVTFGR